MEVRRFPRGQDAPSENPAGSADPVQRTGREGGVCFLCARFLCTSKERWLAPSRRERPCSSRCGRPAGQIKSSSLRSRPPPPSGHLLPQAGEGLRLLSANEQTVDAGGRERTRLNS